MTALAGPDAVALLPEALRDDVSRVESVGNALDRFERICAGIRKHSPTGAISDFVSKEKLDGVNFYVRLQVEKSRKRQQSLNRLQSGRWKLQPYQLWADLGRDAVQSRNFLHLLCDISDICDYPSAVERLNAARDARKEAPRGNHRGIDRKTDRAANDAAVVLEALKQTIPEEVKKRKRDTGACATTDEEGGPSAASDDEVTNAGVEVPLGKRSRLGRSSDVSGTVADIALDGSTLSGGDADAAIDLLPVLSSEDEDTSRLAIAEQGLQRPHSHLATPVASDDSAERNDHASSPLVSKQRRGAAQMERHPEAATQAPKPARDMEVIDVYSVPDSPSEQTPTNHLLRGAIRSLESERCLSTEAVYRGAKLFNPDVLTWYIAEPITVTNDAPAGDGGEVRLRWLQDSHQHVVVLVNIDRSHWTVGIVNRRDRTIQIYDPLRSTKYVARSRQAVQDFARRLPVSQCSDSETEKRWTFDEAPTILRQMDVSNCGIYAVVFVIFAMQKEEPPTLISPAIWREVIASGLQACPGHDLDNAADIGSLLHDPVADISTFEAPTPSVDKASLKTFKDQVQAMAIRRDDALGCMEDYARIGNLVAKVYEAIVVQQRHVEEMMGTIRIRLSLLDESYTTSEIFAPTTSLISMRQLECVKKHVHDAKARCRKVADLAEHRRSHLKEQAKMASCKRIDSW